MCHFCPVEIKNLGLGAGNYGWEEDFSGFAVGFIFLFYTLAAVHW